MVYFSWMSLAITAKRWHDHNKSGWWTAIVMIPLIGPLWTFVECGLLEGDPYENDYGPPTCGDHALDDTWA